MPPGIVVISPGPATVNRREKARVSWWNRAHPTPHAPAGLAEAALINRTARAEDGSHPPRERRGRPRVRHDPIDRRAPGALPYADRPPSAQPLDELPGLTGSEHAPLSRREPPPGDALHLGQRRSESREVGPGHGARYGEGELGARAEPRVGRDGAVQAEVYAGWDAVMRGEPLREGQGPRRVRTLRPEIGGGARLEQQRRCRDRGADAAEAAPE